MSLGLIAACAGGQANLPPAATPSTQPPPQPVSAKGQQPVPEVVDPEATDFPYPYPVHFLPLETQQQALRMAYLDVPANPTGPAADHASRAPAVEGERCIVLLHGKNFSAAAWGPTIDLLSKQGFRVIAPDQIGFGKSSKPGNYQYSFAQLAQNTRSLLDKLGLQRCSVLGHSMGGMLAVRFALLFPATTERLILVNPIGLEDYSVSVPYRTVDEWYADELKQTPDSIREYQRTSYYNGAWKPAYEEQIQLAAGFTRHPDYARVAWASALAYDMIYTQPVANDLPRLRVPTKLIIGLRDRTAVGRKFALPESAATMGDYTQLGKHARDLIPGAQLIELAGVGHVPQVEAFPAFRDALLQLLR